MKYVRYYLRHLSIPLSSLIVGAGLLLYALWLVIQTVGTDAAWPQWVPLAAIIGVGSGAAGWGGIKMHAFLASPPAPAVVVLVPDSGHVKVVDEKGGTYEMPLIPFQEWDQQEMLEFQNSGVYPRTVLERSRRSLIAKSAARD
jgi:hypothetical protein